MHRFKWPVRGMVESCAFMEKEPHLDALSFFVHVCFRTVHH